MVDKFFVDDFPFATIKVSSHNTPELWGRYREYDLVVVDEAHLLAQVDGPDQSPYRELAALAHSAKRVLLLSATPLTSRVVTHLALLHLLDPNLTSGRSERRLSGSSSCANNSPTPCSRSTRTVPSLLPYTIETDRELIPADPQFRESGARADTGIS